MPQLICVISVNPKWSNLPPYVFVYLFIFQSGSALNLSIVKMWAVGESGLNFLTTLYITLLHGA